MKRITVVLGCIAVGIAIGVSGSFWASKNLKKPVENGPKIEENGENRPIRQGDIEVAVVNKTKLSSATIYRVVYKDGAECVLTFVPKENFPATTCSKGKIK